ncbi:Regulator of chromosome condensation 1/beta-lactamase-inhibitor protein II [Sesbania bispinosa]|nr:Regulator of chromosome condensation 1/beta-lactamase-inhibitor protein II [Sesbania bispinosa]
MKNKPVSPSSVTITTFILSVVFILFFLLSLCHSLGSGTTLAVVDATPTVCGVVAEQPTRRIEFYRRGHVIAVEPNIPFFAISDGRSYFCGLRSDNYTLLCWDTLSSFKSKRLYNNGTVLFENLVVGFSYGIMRNGSWVRCWGNESIARKMENAFGNMSMVSLMAGESRVCGLNSTGFLVCKGSNSFGQIDVPQGGPLEFSGLALGAEHNCAIRRSNGSVFCWGGRGLFFVNLTQGVSFEIIVSGSNFTCGLTTNNFSVICWGPDWSNSFDSGSRSSFELPLSPILPGPCVQSSCSECGIYPQSQSLYSGTGNICKPQPCWPQIPVPTPLVGAVIRPRRTVSPCVFHCALVPVGEGSSIPVGGGVYDEANQAVVPVAMAERRWRRCRRRKAKLSHCDGVRFLASMKHREGRSVRGGGGSV